MTDYLTIAEVLAIHEDLIETYGGQPGLRDAGLLEAALFRAESGYYGDVVAETAALWESLSETHPFLDGNKRTAFGAAHAFLKANGVRIAADADAAFTFLDHHYRGGSLNFANLERWLRENTA